MAGRRFIGLWLALVLCLAGGCANSGGDAKAASDSDVGVLPLAGGGKANYVIHVGSAEDPVVYHAAGELAEYLGRITGADFKPLSTDAHPISGRPLIVVGRNNGVIGKLAGDLPYPALGDEGFVIRSVGRNVVIAGARPRGTLYGVYWLLDHKLGVKWFSPDYTFVPVNASPALGVMREEQTPRFTYREIFNHATDDAQWRQHNLLNGDSHHRAFRPDPPALDDWSHYWPEGGHNFHTIVSKTKYGKEHPDWFAGGQLALMNEGVRAAAAEYLVKQVSRRSDRAWTFSQEDRGWNPDAASEAFAKRHGGALSAPVLDMVMDVAERVRRVVPDARIGAEAYQWSFNPPTGMKVPDYVIMTVTPIEADLGQPYNSAANRRFGEGIEGWTRLSNQIVIWDHLTNFGSYIQPFPEIYTMGKNLRWFAQFPQIKGYFGESSYGTRGGEFAELRAWVAGRLLWNPEEDPRALVAQFITGYYGDAAPCLQQYVDLMHESVKRTGSKLTIRTPVTAPYLSFEVMRKADELFDQAEAAVADQPGFKHRVKMARIGVDDVILLRRADYAAAAARAGVAWDPHTKARLARFAASVAAAGITRYGENVGSVKALIAAMAIERHAPQAPNFVRDPPRGDWIDFQDLDVRLYDGEIVADSLASDGGALRMEGKSAVWGVQLPLEKLPAGGHWKLHARVRVDVNAEANPRATAFLYGIYPMENRTVRVSEVADGQYHWLTASGAYQQDAQNAMWFAPPKSDAIAAMYVDRIVAVRQK